MWTSNFEGLEIKSLHITIRDEDGRPAPAQYGVWTSGQGAPQRERSSRLVVKVVSGGGVSDLNLDLCARRFGSNEVERPTGNYTHAPSFLQDGEVSRPPSIKPRKLEIESSPSISTEKLPTLNMWDGEGTSQIFNLESYNDGIASNKTKCSEKNTKHSIESISEFLTNKNTQNMNDNKNINEGDTAASEPVLVNPLDYSIKKVKENNALIMKGIQMLNRTLDYTKNKEMMEMFPKLEAGRFSCSICGKTFVYESGLRRHAVRHAGGVGGHAWQSVWTCGSCYQVWPRRELLTKHSKFCCSTANDVDTREIKTSSLLQCEFCEKVFTSIPRLATHSRNHTSAQNYQCSPCDLTFASYRAAELHWRECTWLLHCYDFILQKMFLCNVCDRKFRNYEQLYNHRYKSEHFTTKTQYTKSGDGQLQMAVCQCELCGQAVPSPAHLQRHRQRSHPPDYLASTYNQDNEDVPEQASILTGD